MRTEPKGRAAAASRIKQELNRFAEKVSETQFGEMTLRVTIHNGVPTIVRIIEEQSVKLA